MKSFEGLEVVAELEGITDENLDELMMEIEEEDGVSANYVPICCFEIDDQAEYLALAPEAAFDEDEDDDEEEEIEIEAVIYRVERYLSAGGQESFRLYNVEDEDEAQEAAAVLAEIVNDDDEDDEDEEDDDEE